MIVGPGPPAVTMVGHILFQDPESRFHSRDYLRHLGTFPGEAGESPVLWMASAVPSYRDQDQDQDQDHPGQVRLRQYRADTGRHPAAEVGHGHPLGPSK